MVALDFAYVLQRIGANKRVIMMLIFVKCGRQWIYAVKKWFSYEITWKVFQKFVIIN